jgi:hypothetical protein
MPSARVVIVAPITDVVCLVMTETEVEGTMIPEVVPVKGILPEVDVLEEAACGPAVIVAPEATEEVRDDTLPESSMDVSSSRRRFKTWSQSVRCRCQRPQRLVVVGSNFWQMTSLTRRWWPATWSRCAGLSSG